MRDIMWEKERRVAFRREKRHDKIELQAQKLLKSLFIEEAPTLSFLFQKIHSFFYVSYVRFNATIFINNSCRRKIRE